MSCTYRCDVMIIERFARCPPVLTCTRVILFISRRSRARCSSKLTTRRYNVYWRSSHCTHTRAQQVHNILYENYYYNAASRIIDRKPVGSHNVFYRGRPIDQHPDMEILPGDSRIFSFSPRASKNGKSPFDENELADVDDDDDGPSARIVIREYLARNRQSATKLTAHYHRIVGTHILLYIIIFYTYTCVCVHLCIF